MRYLRGFVPWILFAIVSSVAWQWGAAAGLLAAALLVVLARRAGNTLDTLILELSTTVFFAALTAIAFAAPHSPLQHWAGVASMSWLALTAWGGLAIGKPFTLGIAKQQTPEAVWHTPGFRQVNVVITTVWAAAFTATALVLALVNLYLDDTAARVIVQVLGFALPAIFTARYPDRARARMTQPQAH